MIRGAIPGTEVRCETVLLGVLMDVDDETHHIRVAVDRNPSERTFEESTRALDGKIDAPGIGVEKVGEILTGRFKTCKVFLIPHIHCRVEMIP
jgi:hypothetical protein